jgi:hypothetical protein
MPEFFFLEVFLGKKNFYGRDFKKQKKHKKPKTSFFRTNGDPPQHQERSTKPTSPDNGSSGSCTNTIATAGGVSRE